MSSARLERPGSAEVSRQAREPSLGQWQLAWRRLRRDKVALVSGAFCVFLLGALFFGGPLLAALLGHGPNDLFPYATDSYLKPVGPWTHVPDLHVRTSAEGAPSTLLVLGADGPLGRDELLRLLYGGRVSLEVAIGATLLATIIGVALGATAGLRGGWIDTFVSRLAEFVMAFPVLLLLIVVGSTSLGDRLSSITLHGALNRGVIQLVVVIGIFTWFYPARIVRAQILSLRSREFVEAATMIGASQPRIVRTHLVPHLIPPMIVYGTLAVATNILLEAGVTFLGAGVHLPTASWGSLLATTWGTLLDPRHYDPLRDTSWLTLAPSIAILLTVLAFNQFGEGLRDALAPVSRS